MNTYPSTFKFEAPYDRLNSVSNALNEIGIRIDGRPDNACEDTVYLFCKSGYAFFCAPKIYPEIKCEEFKFDVLTKTIMPIKSNALKVMQGVLKRINKSAMEKGEQTNEDKKLQDSIDAIGDRFDKINAVIQKQKELQAAINQAKDQARMVLSEEIKAMERSVEQLEIEVQKLKNKDPDKLLREAIELLVKCDSEGLNAVIEFINNDFSVSPMYDEDY